MKRVFMDAFAWVDIENVDTENILTVADLPEKEQKRLGALC